MKLARYYVEKPWGRHQLPPPFDCVSDENRGDGPVGEIWLQPEDGAHLPVLVKYMFTSDKLSVQVHPNDAQGQARGWPSGKNECWYITEAQPGAMLGLGLRKSLGAEELRSAALDGSIEELLDWREIKAGEFYMVPAGTIHAMSAGISLIEFQQNLDLTYRLYDYGRPRELHLDDAVAVAVAGPYPDGLRKVVDLEGVPLQTLAHFPQFDVIYSRNVSEVAAQFADRAKWIVPLSGQVFGEGDAEGGEPGGCLYVEAGEAVSSGPEGASALVGIANC